ncbi:MAG: DUF397 domain-containing protein [Pseudonocardia sp.]
MVDAHEGERVLVPYAEGDRRYVKSSWSGNAGCVEVCRLGDDRVAVRDSKAPARVLHFSTGEWAAFVAGVKAGEFDVE